jgi:cobalamin biosynthesis protein CobD/CbiB
MTHALIYIAAFICETMGLGLAWFNRTTIGTNYVLLGFVAFFIILGFLLAIKSNTEEALKVIVKLRPGDVLNGLRKGDPQVVVEKEEPK